MIKTTTTEVDMSQERSRLSTLLQFPGKSHTEGASILEAKKAAGRGRLFSNGFENTAKSGAVEDRA